MAAAVALAVVAQLPVNVAQANAGFGTKTDLTGATVDVPTYFATSPQGIRPAYNPALHAQDSTAVTGATIDATGRIVTVASTAALKVGGYVTGGGFPGGTLITAITPTTFTTSSASSTPGATAVSLSVANLTVDTGAPLRKFVDTLGGVYNGLENLPGATDLQSGIPLAIPVKWVNPYTGVTTSDDYYELAIVEYTEQLHSDLAKPTRLRGYVQIETPALAGKKDITGLIGSEHIKATYPDGTPILDASGAQVYFAHKPHFLGPVILASEHTAIRLKVTNYLPYIDASGKSVGSWNGQGGESFIPMDETIAGGGPVTKQAVDPVTGAPLLDATGNPYSVPVLVNGKPVKFSNNRATIHWHGGDSPWTNDGTPHQWFTPAGDITRTIKDASHPNGYGEGESFQNVPDMPNPGPGSVTMYYPVNLSGRLMMYHDHVSGETKVNVYEGEAAGLVVYDPVELTLAANALNTTLATTLKPTSGALAGATIPTGLLDAVGIPLVILDRSFVPKNIGPTAVASDGVTPASQDAKWDLTHWGQPGDLFFPHVYETNQDPNSIDGTNPVGRWDWGPWFWPVFPAQFSLPTGNYGDSVATPEAFMDTTMVNGQPYPTMTVDPKAYRFRILGVPNDRSLNLGFYQAVDGAGKVCDATNTAPTPNPTQAYPGQGAPALCTEVRMVPAVPTAGFPATWPTDGRAGGVPDPATAGPDIVQIGNEGGLLPAVAIWKSQPVVYEQNVRSITIFNVLDHDLTLMPGERADAFVDFTNYAGQTLILYNDAPAPFPGYDPRIDYYTGVGDQTMAGGAYDTLPGYGPNTRTVMQFKVNATNTSGQGGPLNVAALTAALPVAYAATQPAPIVPESVYNQAFGTANVDNYAHIGTGSGVQPYWVLNGGAFALTGITLTTGGSLYPAGTTVTIDPPLCTPVVAATACAQATATPVLGAGGVITGFTNFVAGAGYTTVPNVTFSAPGLDGTRASALITANGYKVINKAIQELFDPVYGMMNATLAAELPFSTATVATTIPLAYVDTPIEYLDGIHDGETQIWKITHNGVDSHPVHFHLVNVQVLNRVGWDGVVKPPAANEVGWKEVLRMNPLEDVYVAVKAVHPVVPFGIPQSHRRLDPSQADGSQLGLTQIDPTTGNAPTSQTYIDPVTGISGPHVVTAYSNQLTDFDNEYVWHCHILGHEEFDFMRPFVFHPDVVVPDAPATVAVSSAGVVTWVDTTPVGGQDAQGIPTAGTNAAYPTPTSSPKNEIGYKIYANVTLDANGYVPAASVPVALMPANTTTWTDPAYVAGNVYYVVAYNVAGNSPAGTSATTTTASTTVTPPTPPAATPGTMVVTGTLDATGKIVTVAATTGLVVGASVSGGGFPQGTTITAINSTVAPYTFTTSFVSTAACATAPATLCAPVTLTVSLAAAAATPTPAAAAAPSGLTQALNTNGSTTLSWTAVPGAITYTVSTVETTSAAVVLPAVTATVLPISTAVTGASIDATGKIVTASPTGLAVGGSVSGGGFPAGTLITAISTTGFTTSMPSATPGATGVALSVLAPVMTYTTPVLTAGSTFVFSVSATTLSGTTVAASTGMNNGPMLAPVAFTGVVDATAGSVTLSWANNALNKGNVAGLQLSWTGGTHTFLPTTTGATVTGLTTGTAYTFSLQAVSNVSTVAAVPAVNTVTLTAP
jgi:FtsP/CotA-like multicopper oxidase with cupredoxin domain